MKNTLFVLFREATGVVMHKDSKWQQQWKEFRDNNPVVTGNITRIQFYRLIQECENCLEMLIQKCANSFRYVHLFQPFRIQICGPRRSCPILNHFKTENCNRLREYSTFRN